METIATDIQTYKPQLLSGIVLQTDYKGDIFIENTTPKSLFPENNNKAVYVQNVDMCSLKERVNEYKKEQRFIGMIKNALGYGV